MMSGSERPSLSSPSVCLGSAHSWISDPQHVPSSSSSIPPQPAYQHTHHPPFKFASETHRVSKSTCDSIVFFSPLFLKHTHHNIHIFFCLDFLLLACHHEILFGIDVCTCSRWMYERQESQGYHSIIQIIRPIQKDRTNPNTRK